METLQKGKEESQSYAFEKQIVKPNTWLRTRAELKMNDTMLRIGIGDLLGAQKLMEWLPIATSLRRKCTASNRAQLLYVMLMSLKFEWAYR